jgi:hypothetical protein
VLEETGIILPPGVTDIRGKDPHAEVGGRGMIVNETGLPDHVVQEAVSTYIDEHASMLGVNAGATFQNYGGDGSLLARRGFKTPKDVFEEIALARDMAERDDDIGATLGSMLAMAFGERMQNTHEDEVTVALFNEVAKHARLSQTFKELYREWLISSSVTTVSLFTRESFQFMPEGADRQRTRTMVAPLIGVLPAEQIRVIGNDLFGTAKLAYKPNAGQDKWLREFFSDKTTAARKAEMRREDPVLAALLVGPVEDDEGDTVSKATNTQLYALNPRMTARSTMPKGAWKYPRPLLTRNFALLEAKRLLNLMDYALLQGGSNFLVVAKKGSEKMPAKQEEVQNLHDVVRRASRTGVIIGDHRLSIEIITPDLGELLSASKRNLIGKKLANALLRVPEAESETGAGGEGVKARTELVQRVITADRDDLVRHVEHYQYEEVVRRNPQSLPKGPASIWFPKLILQGTQFFTDYILKMRDRGDIPRRYAVEAGGFDYDAAVQQRKREKASGDDRVMTPAAVPFSSPNQGPQDNQPGRPRGTSSANGQNSPPSAPARVRPRQVVQRNPGETVTAMVDEEVGSFRVGELTYAILEEHADTKTVGRITPSEREALDLIERGKVEPFRVANLVVIPVNEDYEVAEVRAVRLAPGLTMLTGQRVADDALVAHAFAFRAPEFDPIDAQEIAMRWGFPSEPLRELRVPAEDPDSSPEETAAAGGLAPIIHLHVESGPGKSRTTVLRDDDGNLLGSRTEPDGEES